MTSSDLQSKKSSNSSGGGFQTLGLSEPIFRGIQKLGYRTPTPVQRKSLPVLLTGADAVVMARTGSGKTAAFLIPVLERLIASRGEGNNASSNSNGNRSAAAVILSPTRELSVQTLKVLRTLGHHCLSSFKFVGINGGESMEKQFALLSSQPDIIVATPGRLAHHLSEIPDFHLRQCEMVVFDEADRLFEMGFAMQIRTICSTMPEHRQTMLFSATMPKALVEFTKTGMMHDPVMVRLDQEVQVSAELRIGFLTCRTEEKDAILLHLVRDVLPLMKSAHTEIDEEEAQDDENRSEKSKKKKRMKQSKHVGKRSKRGLTLIFAATRHHVEYLTLLLKASGLSATQIYGNMDQSARSHNLVSFQSGETPILVVTDVAARGIDIPLIDHVIHYAFPPSAKLFVHRSGRAARAGRIGYCWGLVDPEELPYMVDLHVFLGRKLSTGRETAEKVHDETREDAYDDVENQPTADGNEEAEITYSMEDMTPDMVHYGSVPESIMVEEVENVRRIVDAELAGSHDADMLRSLKKVCSNAMKQYRRSRPEASREGVRRAKALLEGEKESATGRRVLNSHGGIPPHPLLRKIEIDRLTAALGKTSSDGNNGAIEDQKSQEEIAKKKIADLKKRQEFLRAMANFRPKETVFEAFATGGGKDVIFSSQVDKCSSRRNDASSAALIAMKSMRRQMKMARDKGSQQQNHHHHHHHHQQQHQRPQQQVLQNQQQQNDQQNYYAKEQQQFFPPNGPPSNDHGQSNSNYSHSNYSPSSPHYGDLSPLSKARQQALLKQQQQHQPQQQPQSRQQQMQHQKSQQQQRQQEQMYANNFTHSGKITGQTFVNVMYTSEGDKSPHSSANSVMTTHTSNTSSIGKTHAAALVQGMSNLVLTEAQTPPSPRALAMKEMENNDENDWENAWEDDDESDEESEDEELGEDSLQGAGLVLAPQQRSLQHLQQQQQQQQHRFQQQYQQPGGPSTVGAAATVRTGPAPMVPSLESSTLGQSALPNYRPDAINNGHPVTSVQTSALAPFGTTTHPATSATSTSQQPIHTPVVQYTHTQHAFSPSKPMTQQELEEDERLSREADKLLQGDGNYWELDARVGAGDVGEVDTEKPCVDMFNPALRVLGRGSFGRVVLVQKRYGLSQGGLYAMKILRKSHLVRRRQIERTKTERKVLSKLDHPFIMKLYYAFQNTEKLYLVLDYCPGGELFFHLSRYRRFQEPVARFYAAELLLALGHCHKHGIIYRDLKPENVLLDADGHVKLGDFGLAKDGIQHPTQGAKSMCGTPEYMAPEVLNQTGHGFCVDYWGLGMILFEMMTGLPPWYTTDRSKLFRRLRSAPLIFPNDIQFSPHSKACISGLLERDPRLRLGVLGLRSAMRHEFFYRRINFEALRARMIGAPIRPCEGWRQFQSRNNSMVIESDRSAGGWHSAGPSFESSTMGLITAEALDVATANFDDTFRRMPVETEDFEKKQQEAGPPISESELNEQTFRGFTFDGDIPDARNLEFGHGAGKRRDIT